MAEQGPQNAPFGARLRQLRESAGLTQEELASRAGLTAKAVGALERGERKRPYPHTVRSLADALKLSDEERASLLAAVPKRGDSVLSASASTSEPNLPAPATPLLGREKELEEVRGFLQEVRLLTLTGTGGVGKTRLALEVARDAQLPEGVAFVTLAHLRDAGLVVPTVAQSLGLRAAGGRAPREALHSYLRGKRLLLVLDNFEHVLDNFEHVLDAAPEVAALVESCPDLVVLVTSRAPLRVRGEQEYPVPPLALPASTLSPTAEEILGSPSGSLFVERALAASPAFGLEGPNAAAVAAICWRLAGLPLALELAAAKVKVLSPPRLLARLDRMLATGGARDLPARQRTMRATLDWSYDLLQGTEKGLFRRLSTFAGGFTLEAAESIGVADDVQAEDVLDLLENLVEQSLVVTAQDADGLRYRMLEPVRQYAIERLEESIEEVEVVRWRHAGYYLVLGERAGLELKGPQQPMWLGRLETELGNLRAAMGWSIDHGEVEAVARMAWSSWIFWWLRGHLDEGRHWMEEALAKVPDLPDPVRAKLLFVAGTMAQGRFRWEPARALLEESLSLFQRLQDEGGAAYPMGGLGLVDLGQERLEEGISLIEEACDLLLKIGHKWPASPMLGFAAAASLSRGDVAHARRWRRKGYRWPGR